MLTSREDWIYFAPDTERSKHEKGAEQRPPLEKSDEAAGDGMEPAETESTEEEP